MDDVHRLTIRSVGTDPRDATIRAAAAALGIAPSFDVTSLDVVFVGGSLDDTHKQTLSELLVDPLLQFGTWDRPHGPAVEILPLPGVTDDGATAVLDACRILHVPATGAATGRRIELGGPIGTTVADVLTRRVLANPVIERWASGTIEPIFTGSTQPDDGLDSTRRGHGVTSVEVRELDADGLQALDTERGLALDPLELAAIHAHFVALGRDPTDAELEMLAQTWSEHCAHKTFRARLVGPDGEAAEPLLARLRRCTDSVHAPFVRSAFVGNAGIVSFVDGVALSLKAETHNHPSAVEPFGGANTGMGGVIRDVLGTGHRPIAATDILCFGPPDTPVGSVAPGALHPRRIRDGVVAGVADYGNKIGIPTVAGAVLYDPAYATNPLVFCGCIGIGADRPLPDRPEPLDRVVVLGGRTGRDGIRGATFSSATMDATTGDVAGASVQIGSPITEKLLIDVLVGAEHLYRAITDCGAGGLSSAVGEMADGCGAVVDLDQLPTKYPGLEPWELWLSEAQERMVLAVPPEHLPALRRRCDDHRVELTDLGAFSGDGRLLVRHGGVAVVDLDVTFLHDGRPQRSMTFEAPAPNRDNPRGRTVDDPAAALLALLAHRNIASKADVVHRYDHEVLGSTVVRPLTGHGGPSDGVVLADPDDRHGLAIGVGVNPWYGLHDPQAMAAVAVDEAIRNVVVAGADPDRVALLDNFSWGDPRRPATLGSLVAAVDGCCAAAIAHGAPFVSGKDSLNNEYTGTDGHRHAVPPTLVITAVAHVPDAGNCPTTDLAVPGNVLVLVGTTGQHFAGSHLDLVVERTGVPGLTPQHDPLAPARYRRLHRAIRARLVVAAHDLAEGGLAVALAEMAIGGALGARLDRLGHDDVTTGLFSESAGRLLVEIHPADLERFLAVLGDAPSTLIGTVTAETSVVFPGVRPMHLDELTGAFNRVGLDP